MISGLNQVGVLVDVTRCTGCGECVDACSASNRLEKPHPAPQQTADGLSDRQWASIVPGPQGGFVRKFCRHCLEPACVSACPVGAMQRTPEGIVIYDANICMGCRYCLMACPFGIPRYEWDSRSPRVHKCFLCYDRLREGGLPACVEACPEGVLAFGERDSLIAEAHSRIDRSPGSYLPVVYGEQDAGGTAVMYISHVPLDFLGYHQVPGNHPLPGLTWNWLSKTPGVALGSAGLMTGLFWIIGRRMQAEEARAAQANAKTRDH